MPSAQAAIENREAPKLVGSDAVVVCGPASAGLWNYELHEDYYVLNCGAVQVGILFPDTGMPVGYVRDFVATLNAHYPTPAGHAGSPTERQPTDNNKLRNAGGGDPAQAL